MKYSHHKIVGQMKPTGITKRLEFAQAIPNNIKESPNYVKYMLFSEETVLISIEE